MANWQCPDCEIVVDASDQGQVEECPRCGLGMEPVRRIDGCNTPSWVSVDGQSGEDGECYTFPG
jgi:hypothetical protein